MPNLSAFLLQFSLFQQPQLITLENLLVISLGWLFLYLCFYW